MKIFKYQIYRDPNTYGVFDVSLPCGAKILYVGVQNDVVTLWAAVNDAAASVTRKIQFVGTGQDFPTGGNYIGSVQQGGAFVWHIFDMLSLMKLVDLERIRITKVYSKLPSGERHPNGIETGYVAVGKPQNELEVGNAFYMAKERPGGILAGVFHTSEITQINDDDTFETLNSVYKIERTF